VIPFDEALDRVLLRVLLLPGETVPLSDAAGRVLAGPVDADLDLPPFDTTAMDGWAVRRSDVGRAPAELLISGVIGAGSVYSGTLPAGHALKVMTGAPMPAGADAVVPVEEAEEGRQGRVRLLVVPKAGAHVRHRGEVIAAGAPLLRPGRRLSAGDLAVAAAAGRPTLDVARRPRALVLVTGDEVVPAGERPGPGQIRNTNEPLLVGSLRRLGADVTSLGAVSDDPAKLREALGRGLDAAPDLLLTTGGVSAGDFDLVGPALADLGATLVFHKVSIRPAKPILFATLGATLVFGLPGNPVSSAVAIDLFVRPALRKAAGLEPALPPPVPASLTAPIRNKGPRLAFHPARVSFSDRGTLLAEPLATRGSHDLVTHALASGYLVLAPDGAAAAGDRLPVHLASEDTTFGGGLAGPAA